MKLITSMSNDFQKMIKLRKENYEISAVKVTVQTEYTNSLSIELTV